MKNILKKSFALAAALVLTTAASQASFFHVNINTAALNLAPASANGPFSLDFQFNDGGVLGNNSATISNFTYGAGSATGSATLIGGALGNIGSTVTFDNTSAFQELFQTFTPGAILGFDVSLTQNLDGATPDGFVVAILDNNLLNITTNGLGDSLLLAEINTTNPIPTGSLSFGAGTGNYAGVTLTAVPEPGTALFGAALLGACVTVRRRK